MGENSQNPTNRGADGHLAVCEHEKDCCMIPTSMPIKIGKKWASALAGFIAGAVVAAIVLVPWMLVQGQFCEEAAFPKISPSTNNETMFTEQGGQILEAAPEVRP